MDDGRSGTADRVADRLQPADLVGCGYRLVQRRRHPDVPRTEAARRRLERLALARRIVLDALPTRPALGDGRSRRFLRIDIPAPPVSAATEEELEQAEFDTLEALAAEANLITGATFTGTSEGAEWRVDVDVLARRPDGTYLPVIVSNHRVARPHEASTMPMVATSRLGLSEPMDAPFRQRHHVADGYRLGLAARALAEVGLDSGWGGAIGQDRTRAFITRTGGYQEALTTALTAPLPDAPRRVKECASCRFWSLCEPELLATDDISLFLPGDRAAKHRAEGITTVSGLIDAPAGQVSELARAWRDGIPLLRRVDRATAPRADVEIDVDMEAYLDQGAYLWGTFDGDEYRPFVTWRKLGGAAEAENFARFWAWLMGRRAAAHAAGQTFAAYCYSSHGENHWMLQSARRFAGRRFGEVTVPDEDEVTAFIGSDEWIDIFRSVREQLAGPRGLGLKLVAPEAGFTWDDEDFDGEESIHARRVALSGGPEAEGARARLLRYNSDDCRATAAVRVWLDAGAPGTPLLGE
ncbi:TM0106 family RecB-like putative nuclease [Corynebacterium halotolerans]|uniref:YprB ribonuclease H-like domain-containing protein n=1 Tax=Corynebacterium halotolerans YIM 70093 = DSM 44683 TaxID=1121362 RepID=M1NW09_9CORY|nr:TM0106 family RecB-like putative nuclease [Corynebacterium halotolerans]AGF73662.1 hypothetical protein A605_13330 [Corynebacterium halotolerans YIM 70093 = DSM 44683]